MDLPCECYAWNVVHQKALSTVLYGCDIFDGDVVEIVDSSHCPHCVLCQNLKGVDDTITRLDTELIVEELSTGSQRKTALSLQTNTLQTWAGQTSKCRIRKWPSSSPDKCADHVGWGLILAAWVQIHPGSFCCMSSLFLFLPCLSHFTYKTIK